MFNGIIQQQEFKHILLNTKLADIVRLLLVSMDSWHIKWIAEN